MGTALQQTDLNARMMLEIKIKQREEIRCGHL
jgi:hypothetical protein